MVTNDFYLSLLLNHPRYNCFYCGRLHAGPALELNENGQVGDVKLFLGTIKERQRKRDGRGEKASN